MTEVAMSLWTILVVGAMLMTWDQGELDRLVLAWFIGIAVILLARCGFAEGGETDE